MQENTKQFKLKMEVANKLSNIEILDFSGIKLILNELQEKNQARYFCQLCGHLMRNPVQTYQGNTACLECYKDALKRNDGNCPLDGTPIIGSKSSFFRDKAKEMEILNLVCYCIHRDKGCQWNGTICDLIKRHNCNYKPHACNYCSEHYSNEKEHLATCVSLIKEGDCFFKKVGCPFKATKKEQMAKHIIEHTDIHSAYEADEQRNTVELQQVVEENKKLKQTVAHLTTKIKNVEENSTQQYNDVLDAITEFSKNKGLSDPDTKSLVDKVMKTAKQNTENLGDLDLKFQLHENSVDDGHLVWKVNNFQQRSTDAVIGKTRALHSAPCFTSKYGYKFCLRLYLHGDGMGKGTHLSLFLVLMKSEYDNILEWPFQKKIKFTLINQEDRSKDHMEKMFPNKDSSSFQKPKKDMNIASGCPMFMNLNRLQSEGFLKDDSLFVEVKID